MGMVCASKLCQVCPACPCCGYSTEAQVKQELKDILKTWIKRITDIAPETRLKNLTMMAAHDCGTYSIPKTKIGSSLSRTQSEDVYEQLDLGVRQIDFRYGPVGLKADDLAVRHGPHSGENYFRELIKVKNWIEDNPHEFLIIDARCEKKISQEQRNFLVHFLLEKFGKVLITKKDTETWFKVDRVTLGDLAKNHPRRVLLLVDSMIKDFPGKSDSPQVQDLLYRDHFIVSPWHNTGNVTKLFEKVEKSSHTMYKDHPQHFFNFQLILTPKGDLTNITRYCFCMDRGRVDQKHYLMFLDKKVQLFVRSLAGGSKAGQTNFVMMDFVNYDPLITQFLVGLNFPYTLNIESASLVVGKKTHDVKKTVNSLVSKDNSLWIVSASKDLEIKFKTAELHLVYKYGAGKLVEKKIFLNSHDQYLLNCITHLDVTLDVRADSSEITADFTDRKSEIFHDTETCPLETQPKVTKPCQLGIASLQNMCSPLLPDLSQSFASFSSFQQSINFTSSKNS